MIRNAQLLQKYPTWTPVSFSILSILFLKLISYDREYSFCEFRLVLPAASPPSLLPTPSLLASQTECETCCESTAQQQLKTYMCYQHSFGHKNKTNTMRSAEKLSKLICPSKTVAALLSGMLHAATSK